MHADAPLRGGEGILPLPITPSFYDTHAGARNARNGPPNGPRAGSKRIAVPAAVAIGGAVVFAVLARAVAGRAGTPVDETMRRRVQSHRSLALDRLGYSLATSGYPVVYVPVALVLREWIRRRGEPGGDAVVGAAVAGWAAHHVVKRFLTRERPPSQAGEGNANEAFPSGHTTGATVVTLTTAYILARNHLASMPHVLTVALGAPVTIGLTRVYLDEHWASDVAGGWALGVVVAAVAAAAFESRAA